MGIFTGGILVGYILVPIAFVVMLKNYKSTNWLWLGFLIISIFIGVAPFVAGGYLVTAYRSANKRSLFNAGNSTIKYNPDGSYIVYRVEDTKTAPSPGKTAFRIVGGIIAGATIAFGLLFIGVILLFTLAPSVACGGSSKCY